MILYPLIELLEGRCVSLFRGRMEEPQIWHVDPVAKAAEFAKAGAGWIHITDFDALQGDERNADTVREIIRTAGASVQLGGGFRSLKRIEEWIEAGAGRIVVGTLAVQQPDLVKEAARAFPEQIVVSVDVYKGHVAGEGWREQSAMVPSAVLKAFADSPLAAFIVTDIDADLDEAEDSLALVTQLSSETRTPVIARGLTRSLDDLSRMKYVPHLAGAVVGRALFDKSIDLEQALEIVKPVPEERAQFI
ncbi:HisA/HisF-related TIM barrel protein [Mameliella sediminis]|uniref:1-(5-phosphoribosyl)-5-[(5- phosphoribosylamino)methylideneamino]imidazole-4- carboxamide isomerase n=1 Tax=Mameliella sediminis TaxID=2836866 RepID=UPI001C46C279|nr:1-(5-phosphoribosyl)-5-[(5-phosphoribosylamino)methylideneamino] imidazole-4-carboxamide isomerase [Mameliella sediminis]MBV7397003.1 1-(5-phosphoribosyl)-5-[(5-phosphoribosylamino)methylideneamino] imidazole-4-carboxamide isomerase [Mameliella sediminis]MBY6161871.1 1-(5-phosphoribosyl)-5-[(5-phosphoribosylamino)methylideneamino] imidazole-4-carboxamide isomerase [Mameliella alba]MBY6170341.1 1-(5-phosphoribosyl)-5-[(5-phosphoribosylamino)methylideneamino] imidazole-4-carboxamide isomerase [